VGVSTITGNVTIYIVVVAYGLQAYHTTINPCALNLAGFCPMQEGPINLPLFNLPVGDALKEVPGQCSLDAHKAKVIDLG